MKLKSNDANLYESKREKGYIHSIFYKTDKKNPMLITPNGKHSKENSYQSIPLMRMNTKSLIKY